MQAERGTFGAALAENPAISHSAVMPLSDAANVSLLFIIGGDEPDRVVKTGDRIRLTGSSDLSKLLLDREPYHRLHVTRNILRQGRIPDLSGYKCLLNLITEPEQNSRTLESLRKLLKGVAGKVINRPEAVLRSSRDQVARLLNGIPGLIVPKAVRLAAGKAAIAARVLQNSGIAPPIILRQAGTHTGKIVGLFDTIEDAVAAIESNREHVATQFVNFASADGIYRKFRVFFIGQHVILRHMIVSDHWNVHVKDRLRFMAEHPELIVEERELFEKAEPFAPAVREVFRQVGERMPLDFFGMDFAITEDGEVVLFEANATMSFFPLTPNLDPQFEHLRNCLAPAQAAFRQLLGLPPEIERMARIKLQA